MIPDPDLDAVKSEIETHIRGSVILSLNPDPESDFKPFGDFRDSNSSQVKSGIVTSLVTAPLLRQLFCQLSAERPFSYAFTTHSEFSRAQNRTRRRRRCGKTLAANSVFSTIISTQISQWTTMHL